MSPEDVHRVIQSCIRDPNRVMEERSEIMREQPISGKNIITFFGGVSELCKLAGNNPQEVICANIIMAVREDDSIKFRSYSVGDLVAQFLALNLACSQIVETIAQGSVLFADTTGMTPQ